MKKLLMLIIQFSFIVSLIFSYGAGWQHDEELHRVLFGTNDIWNESNELDTEKILKEVFDEKNMVISVIKGNNK